MKPTVVHVTPHLGGGVGSVFRALVDGLQNLYGYRQTIITFEDINEQSQKWLSQRGYTSYSEISPLSNELHTLLCAADIVHIHFWTHPLVYQFLWAFSGKTARIVMWAHCNGHHAPYLFPNDVLKFPQIFVTTSEYSLTAKSIQDQPEEWREVHIRNITSCCDTTCYTRISPKEHSGITVGYVGTVDYCKMHRATIDMLAAVDISDVHFVFYGGDSHEIIKSEAEAKGVADRFEFFGNVKNIPMALTEVDIFAYPLNPEHYGTGEQALVEAMAAGIPQVVLNNGPESYIVQNGVTGIIANNYDEFTHAIELLACNPVLREQMRLESQKHVSAKHTTEAMLSAWATVYEELLSTPKKQCFFDYPPLINAKQEDVAMQLFLCSLVKKSLQKKFISIFSQYPNKVSRELSFSLGGFAPIFFSKTKGSIHHFAYLLRDPKISYVSTILQEDI